MQTETLKLDPVVMQTFRDHVFKKYGKLYGMIKGDAEAALLAWVEADK